MNNCDAYSELLLPLKSVSISEKFTFVDLFSGIGGFRIALEDLGGKCLGYSEIDPDAIEVYQRNFINYLNPNEPNFGNITHLGKLPLETEIDLIVGGVPCQPWSIAGKIKGFEDARGQLWFDAIRVVEENQPKAFIFENVKGLIEPRHQSSFEVILKKID